ncbi:NSFL1 cofactor p47 [Tetrabaena socialis]|uniref:NSFL1 cofactor p47 n=1 Tax=Tetrabaena socialis TaxID=47790 RepID=A0A2J8AE34_9CHLO|nr:NSFL1 cofactor p47 [Tetrabaena socialis]|eukprot:PNH10780.1 NSFL1 cofactor p47 [Tetrabaena socialis]
MTPGSGPSSPYFTGSGRTLGGSAAGASTSAAAAAAAAPASDSGPVEWAGVDESKPTTSLQLRLPDGSRMVARFNHTHLVRDIRRFVRASRPDLTAPYVLMTAFPNKVVEGEEQTLEAAGLLNAVIILKQ